MQSLRHLLPSAGNLIVFEAAGRLASFTAAGRELGMTQAAVSYAIRGLEEQLGTKLFERRHRQVLLTEGATPHSTGELPWRTSFGSSASMTTFRSREVCRS